MEEHRGRELRVVASLHSWSPVAATDGITIDMSGFQTVRVLPEEHAVWLGAGCSLQRALDQLRQSGWTLPTLGAVKRQTIAGAISTGTHGSGAPGLSHFVHAVRVARYCPKSGQPVIEIIDDGEELKAARCALGCLGILLEVRLSIRWNYLVEETLRTEENISDLLTRFSDHPLSFFVLAPYTNQLVMWQRREVSSGKQGPYQRFIARLWRLQNYLGVDVFFHLLITAVRRTGLSSHRRFFEIFPKLLLLDKPVVDDSESQLTLAHDLFRHEEMELFFPAAHMDQAVPFIGEAIKVAAGDRDSLNPEIEKRLQEAGLADRLQTLKGTYLHHYPVSFRRVQPEDTLISMASGSGVWYSASFFTYSQERQNFYDFCSWMARSSLLLFGARPHWGKHFPLSSDEVSPLYPELETFREICRERDPDGVFLNDYTRRVLGL